MNFDVFEKNQHLISRAGFGLKLNDIATFKTQSTAEITSNLLRLGKDTKAFTLDISTFITDYKAKVADADEKKQFQYQNRLKNGELIQKWSQQMVESPNQLGEKMHLFWTGHFATRVVPANFNLQLQNEIRKHGLGSFRDLLFAVSKSSAMLQFLNNQQNKKGHPNENFAREVMELFTIGRGNYTETDVKEAARAFTGWSFIPNEGFFERPRQHDNDNKTFLGKTGNFDGNDVLNIILDQRKTATFITRKIYKFFVNEKADENKVAELAQHFFDSDYDIGKLMTAIFTSDWFYDEKNRGNKIKSPLELLVGIQRMLPMEINNPKTMVVFQKLLGQMLLYPPNVAGWPSGKSWIDSSSLMLRLKIPQIFAEIISLDYAPKDDDDVQMGMKQNLPKNLQGNFKINWNEVLATLKNENVEDLLLLKKNVLSQNILTQFSADNSIKSRIIAIMSTPEYQLC